MRDEFFRMAVIGPLAPRLLSVVGSCTECSARQPAGGASCAGFGPGCLGAAQRGLESDPGDLRVRLRRP